MSKISKIFGGGADKSAQRAAEEARQREAQRQARLTQGRGLIDDAYSEFDDNFYNSRAQSYMDFALPQLDEQLSKQKQKLVYALSRGGKLQSTSAASKYGELQDEYERNKELIKSRGQGYATDARRSVGDDRARLLSILSSTEDPTTVGNEAVRSAALLRESPSFDPLGNLFTDIADSINKIETARQAGQAYRGAGLFQDRGGKSYTQVS